MIIADFNIICINQTACQICAVSNEVVCEMLNRNNDTTPVYPLDKFSAAHSLRGWWYTYWPNDNLFFDFSFFDLNLRTGANSIQLQPRWKDTIYELLSFYIDASPIHTVGVLVRVQDRSNNIVHRQTGLTDFIESLLHGDIHFNELYFITA